MDSVAFTADFLYSYITFFWHFQVCFFGLPFWPFKYFLLQKLQLEHLWFRGFGGQLVSTYYTEWAWSMCITCFNGAIFSNKILDHFPSRHLFILVTHLEPFAVKRFKDLSFHVVLLWLVGVRIHVHKYITVSWFFTHRFPILWDFNLVSVKIMLTIVYTVLRVQGLGQLLT